MGQAQHAGIWDAEDLGRTGRKWAGCDFSMRCWCLLLLVKGCRISSLKFTAFLAESDAQCVMSEGIQVSPHILPRRPPMSPAAGGAKLAEQDLSHHVALCTGGWSPSCPPIPLRETAL